MMGARQEILRMSCNGVEIRLRVNPDSSWVVIRFPDREPFYREFEQSEVAAVLAQYHSVDGNAERFNAFVNSLPGEATSAFAEEECERK